MDRLSEKRYIPPGWRETEVPGMYVRDSLFPYAALSNRELAQVYLKSHGSPLVANVLQGLDDGTLIARLVLAAAFDGLDKQNPVIADLYAAMLSGVEGSRK
ncbi:hypothetical protein HYU12_04955 [Candidatus Woesearchaeota archaeon]|nr:hypothetical protein [Candidatus Woesearchaeota archaeon]